MIDRRYRNALDKPERLRRAAVARHLCCKVFCVLPEQMYSPLRGRPSVSAARQIAYFVCYEFMRLTTYDIGAAFDRDRQAVDHGIRAVRARLAKSADTREVLAHLRGLVARQGLLLEQTGAA